MSNYQHEFEDPDNNNFNSELRYRKQTKNRKNTNIDEFLPDISKENDDSSQVSENDDNDKNIYQEIEHDENAETDSDFISRDNLNYISQFAEDGESEANEDARLSIGEDDENKDSPVKRNMDIEDTTDNNDYQNKKTIAQGMMDIALLTANANQLRYVLESYENHPYFYPSIILISISIIFQFAVGIGLILNYRCDRSDEAGRKRSKKFNDITTIGIYIITTVNCFISAFCVSGRDTSQTISADQTMQIDAIS